MQFVVRARRAIFACSVCLKVILSCSFNLPLPAAYRIHEKAQRRGLVDSVRKELHYCSRALRLLVSNQYLTSGAHFGMVHAMLNSHKRMNHNIIPYTTPAEWYEHRLQVCLSTPHCRNTVRFSLISQVVLCFSDYKRALWSWSTPWTHNH